MKNDLISRQAAIDALGEDALWDSDDEYETGMHTQWSMDVDAIKALPSVQPDYKDGWIYTGKKAWEFEPCEDTISRQAAIDAVALFDDEYRIRDAIEDLPSVEAISVEWIERKIARLKEMDNAFASLTASQIMALLNDWRTKQNEG